MRRYCARPRAKVTGRTRCDHQSDRNVADYAPGETGELIMQNVEGKVAFITGAASGIGLGMAKVFLKNKMKVIVADIIEDRLADAAADLLPFGPNFHLLQVDVTDRVSMDGAADEAERVFGKVHILCNNAGVNANVPMDLASYEDWDWVLGVNLGGVINGIVTFVPRIKAHGEGGHIVNTSSMAGLIPLPGTGGMYSASKFAVRGLSDCLRLRLGAFNIGVSTLCPGLTRSRILESEAARPAHLAPKTPAKPRKASEGPSAANSGMSPVEVGERVLRGIRENDPYILTHGEFKDEVRGLFDDILSAFPDDPADAGRIAFEDGRRRMTNEARAQADSLKG
jgi:NAD(P)-dependent dehydrogenase (short-subunit alcohol dehydrogenase family)